MIRSCYSQQEDRADTSFSRLLRVHMPFTGRSTKRDGHTCRSMMPGADRSGRGAVEGCGFRSRIFFIRSTDARSACSTASRSFARPLRSDSALSAKVCTPQELRMGAFNTMVAKLTCPHCGQRSAFELQFKFGDTWQYQYKVGDRLRWGGNDHGTAGLPCVFVEAIGDCAACGAEYLEFEIRVEDDVLIEVFAVEKRSGSTDWPGYRIPARMNQASDQ